MTSYKYIFLLLITSILACKSEETKTTSTEKAETEIAEKSTAEMKSNLEGTWKEPEYPFRRAEFKNSTVKFVEEGIEEAPRFKKFEISTECDDQVNNIKEIAADELILQIPEDKHCEKIKISKDTLLLSGYNTHTKKEYQIVYKKQE